MVGAGGATAGAEGPDLASVAPGLGDIKQQLDAVGNGAGASGAKAAGDFGAGFIGELEQTVARARLLIEQLRGMMDFSVSPRIEGTTTPTTPGRQSSLTNYDHSRTSAAHVFPLG
jgi:hypothetical protein